MKTLKLVFRPLFLIGIVLIAFTNCSKDDEEMPTVMANFTYVVNSETGTVNFMNTSQNADSYQWDFGDGATSTDINPTHVFTEGTYMVTLVAENVAGDSNSFMDEITIEGDAPEVNNLLTNGDFESGTTGWIGNALDVQTEGGNSYNFANVASAGNPYDVNLSYVVEITQGQTYRLTFDASSDGSRTMLAGIGLNQDPWTNTFQTVNLTSTSQTFTLELTATDFGGANSRVIFDMGAATGVVVIDNVILEEIEDSNPGTGGAGDNLLTNGDFESGTTGWIGNALDVQTEGGNSYNFANVAMAGNAFDVNISNVVEITQGKTYRLTFDASSDGSRTILAGIGLNQDPWTNVTETVNLTATSQTFTYDFTATDFGGANSRVLFDMGADTGVIVIDNVILEEIEGSNPGAGGGSGSNVLTNGDFESGTTGWIGNALDVQTEGGNSYNFANVAMAGNAFDVNISNVVEITQGKTYRLTFDASSDGSRTILAGIGLNQDPWTNVTETVNLTATSQTFTYDFTATDFGGVNSRVLFDMGADTGVVVIDNVTLVEVL